MGTNTIYVTGLGVISSIGDNIEESLYSFTHHQTGIGKTEYLDTIHKDVFMTGEVKHSNSDLLEMLNIPFDDYKNYTRTSLLAISAARQACEHAGLSEHELRNAALISASTVGGMDKTELLYGKSGNNDYAYVNTHRCGDSTDKTADYLGLKGYRTTLSTACSSGANAIIHGIRLIRNNQADIVVAGGVDALSKFTLNGFNSLLIFDTEHCKPFDKNRKGLNLGEGAGFIVLESEASVKQRHKQALCIVSGYANANDAYHQTASSPEGIGATLSMKKALEIAGLSPSQIDYINVHGTGTENNDMSEGVAIKNIFNNQVPPFSSTKSFTGHTLGAAAGIEAVFSVMAIQHSAIFPNLSFSEAIPELGMVPVTKFKSGVNLNHVLSNSFGFGGNNSTLIFSAI